MSKRKERNDVMNNADNLFQMIIKNQGKSVIDITNKFCKRYKVKVIETLLALQELIEEDCLMFLHGKKKLNSWESLNDSVYVCLK